MIIAAVINEKNDVVPIIDGRKIRIYDTEKQTFKDFDNPANYIKEGRRGAALQFAEGKGATAFVTPPQTFCELSYAKAKNNGIQFYPINKSISYEQFVEKLKTHQLLGQTELREDDIAPSY